MDRQGSTYRRKFAPVYAEQWDGTFDYWLTCPGFRRAYDSQIVGPLLSVPTRNGPTIAYKDSWIVRPANASGPYEVYSPEEFERIFESPNKASEAREPTRE